VPAENPVVPAPKKCRAQCWRDADREASMRLSSRVLRLSNLHSTRTEASDVRLHNKCRVTGVTSVSLSRAISSHRSEGFLEAYSLGDFPVQRTACVWPNPLAPVGSPGLMVAATDSHALCRDQGIFIHTSEDQTIVRLCPVPRVSRERERKLRR
jgi:hypothetical protein